MCSIGDDYEDNNAEFVPQTRPQSKVLTTVNCNKCKREAARVVLRGKYCYCKHCFVLATTHKFKSLLGKHHTINPNERILIYYKTGHASTALLHFLRSGLDLTTPKQLRIEPFFICIEDFFELNINEKQEIVNKIHAQITACNFTLYFIPLLSYINNAIQISDCVSKNRNIPFVEYNQQELRTLMHKQANLTSYHDILHIYRRKLLLDVAKHLHCKCIFTPELAEDVASQLLTNVSLGRGFNLPLDTVNIHHCTGWSILLGIARYRSNSERYKKSNGFCDTRDSEVKIVRPLRVFETKELAFYNVFNCLQPVSLPYKTDNAYTSSQSLMKKFISELQVNYSSTVMTVIKTGDKLSANNCKQMKCKFCEALIENDNAELTAAKSINFSRFVSTAAKNVSHEEYYGNKKPFDTDSSNNYCYACNRILNCI